VDGQRVRKSMRTRDWARATRLLALKENPALALVPCLQPGCAARVENGRCEKHTREIPSAITAYHNAYQDAAERTKRNRRRALKFLEDYLIGRGVNTVDEIDLEMLNAFARRALTPRAPG
jgi:hypothetical protein